MHERILATFNAYDHADVDLYSEAMDVRCGISEVDTMIRNRLKYEEFPEGHMEALRWVEGLMREHLPASIFD